MQKRLTRVRICWLHNLNNSIKNTILWCRQPNQQQKTSITKYTLLRHVYVCNSHGLGYVEFQFKLFTVRSFSAIFPWFSLSCDFFGRFCSIFSYSDSANDLLKIIIDGSHFVQIVQW